MFHVKPLSIFWVAAGLLADAKAPEDLVENVFDIDPAR
jgi:hypothetical protein